MRRTVVPAILALVLATGTSCELLQDVLQQTDVPIVTSMPPIVTLADQDARLVRYPALRDLGLYSCGRLLTPTACAVFGAPPAKASLEFQFEVVFHIDNPNRVPVPATELLAALHLWPDRTFGEFAGVCTTLCEPGTEGCPIPAGGACVDQAADVQDLETFLAAALRGVITLAWEAATGQPVGGQWDRWTVAPSSTLDLTFTFSLGIDPMLKLVEEAAPDVLRQVLTSGGGELVIPYAIAGKLWFQVPYLGRVAVGIGPFGKPPASPLTWRVF